MRHKIVPVSLIILLIMVGPVILGTPGIPLLSQWGGGPFLLSLIQDNIRGTVSAKAISGNLIGGVTYQDLVITGPDGRVFLEAEEAVFRLSFWSIPTLHLDIAVFGLKNAHIQLVKSESGRWNYHDLLKPAAPPSPEGEGPPTPGLMARIKKFIFRKVDLRNVWIENGRITATQAGVPSIYKEIELKSKLTLIDLGEQSQRIEVDYASLGVTAPQGRVALETSLTFTPELTKFESLELTLGGLTILSAQGELCTPLQELTCKFSGKLGTVRGEVISKFWDQWPAAWDLMGSFQYSSTPHGANLESQGKIGQADYRIKGSLNAKVKPEVFGLDLDIEGLTTEQLWTIKAIKPQQIQGLSPVKAHLELKGAGLPWDPKSLQTQLALEPFRYKDLKVEKARIDLSGDAQRQKLLMIMEGNFGALRINGDGHLLPLGQDSGVQGDLAVQTENLKPAMLGMANLSGTILTSRFTGKFRLPPGLSPAQLYLAGDLNATGQVKNQTLNNLQASFALEGRRLTIANADVQAAGIVANLKGTVSDAAVDVTFGATTRDSRALPMPAGSSFGSLRVQGAVRGSFHNPQINLAGEAASLAFNGNRLQSATLDAQLSGLPPQSGNIRLHGTGLRTAAGNFSRVTLDANGSGGQWQFQMAGTAPQKDPQFELAGAANLQVRPLDFYINKISWQSHNLSLKNRTPFQVRLLPGYEISPASFLVDGGTVELALVARPGELSGNLQIHNLDACLLQPLGLTMAGKIKGKTTLAGTPAAPEITAQLSVSGGQVKDIPFQILTTTLNYGAAEMQVSGYLQAGPQNSRLVWKGAVPVSLSLIPFKFDLADRGLDLKVQSQNINLSLLTLFTKEVQKADIKVEAVAEAQGNPRAPNISGDIRWTQGTLLLRQAGTPYAVQAGEIRLQGDRITVPGIVITSKGTARFSGEVALTGDRSARAAARLDDFLVVDRGGNTLEANGAVELTGPLSALVARGGITVPRANFRPTFFQTGQNPEIVMIRKQAAPRSKKAAGPDIYNNMTVDVTIDAPRGVRLKDPKGTVELTANLRAKKSPGQELALGGTIRSLHGSLEVEGKEFDVERAILTLPGEPKKPILVDAKATHEVEEAEITIVVTISGTLTNPHISLESLPPLPPTDVLSYLVFGAPSATLTRDQYLTFAAQYGILGGAGGNKLGEMLGSTLPFLSGVKVRTGLASGRPSVGLEKKVTKNVSLFVNRKLNEERGIYEQQAGIQYKFNRHLSIESQVGTRNSGADVFFNYDF